MFRYSKLALCCLPLILAGCVGAPISVMPENLPEHVVIAKPTPEVPVLASACGAEKLSQFVGQPLTVLNSVTINPPHRVVRPDMVLTKEYFATRLNVSVDRDGVITGAYCG